MSGSGLPRRAVAACAAAAGILGGAVACARQGAPPGGPPDRIPPFVVSTTPDTFETVEPFGGSIRVEFNERISERVSGGAMDNAVEISPRTGDVRVSHGRRRIDVSISGGFLEGVVYRVTVLPVIQDMFGNPLREPFEFFFSTGPPFTDNALAGALEDRITGQPVSAARVDAVRAGDDSVAYTTVSDDQGIFALRRIPVGTYEVRAYVDVNRTYAPDFIELQGSAGGHALGASDTVLTFIDLVQPDTTPAVLVGVDAVDSVTLEIGFDDFLDPDSALDGVTVTLEPDSSAADLDSAPAVSRILHAHAFTAFADSVRAVADSLAALADTTAPAPAARPPGPEPTPPGGPVEAGRILPSQLIYVILDSPMVPSALYRVTAAGVTNLIGLSGGGGDALVSGPEPPPPPDSAATDSLPGGAPIPDSLPPPPDSAGPAADTAAGPPPDATSALPPDTTSALPPDTTSALPTDTTPAPPPDAMSRPRSPTSGARPGIFGLRRLRD